MENKVVEELATPAPVPDQIPPLPPSLTVHVSNPTDHARRQPVIFGTKDATPYTYKSLPASYLNVGWVNVPARHTGVVNVLPKVDSPYKLHPSIAKASNAGLTPYVTINGVRADFVFHGVSVNSQDLVVMEFQARTADGVAKLWSYQFSNYPITPFELAFYCESLTTKNKHINLKFAVQSSTAVFTKIYIGDPNNLINEMMDDCQGRVWRGVSLFYDPQAIDLDFNTGFAEWGYPLFALANWPTWGPWDKPVPDVPRSMIDQDIAQRRGIRYSDTFGHFGMIGAKSSGQTGDQGGWGTWQNYLTIGGRTSELMFMDYLASMQDNVRPVHYFEVDGSRFNVRNHPRAVFWTQKVHWHPVVGPDRLGRIHDGNPLGPWTGYDDQHCSGTCIANQSILNGSLAARDYSLSHIQAIIAQETLPSVFDRWSTNTVHVGRGARMYMTAVMHYYATGDPTGIHHIARHLNEMLFNTYNGYNGQPVAPWIGLVAPSWRIKPSRIINDPRILPNQNAWVVWEDSIFAMCIDTLVPVLNSLGYTAEANKLLDVVWDVAKSVTMYGWDLTRMQIAHGILWLGNGEPPPDYSDPTQFKPADGTAFKLWAIPCIEIAKREATRRGDNDVVARANLIIDSVLAEYNQNDPKYVYQFIGAK